MFGFFTKKKQPQIQRHTHFGYMGKIPLKPDFVKLNVTSREIINFDHWLQEGFASVSREYKKLASVTEIESKTLFYVSANEEESSILGVLQPSCDSSARKYPFASYVVCQNGDFRQQPAFLFFDKFNALNSLLNVNERIISSDSVPKMEQYAHEFSTLIRPFSEPIEYNQSIDSLRTIKMQDFWQAISFHEHNLRAQLISQLSGLLNSMANRGCLRSQFGLKLPMPEFSEQVKLVGGIWLHLIANMVADHNWQPWWFYQIGNEAQKPCLILFCRPVSASYFDAVWLNNNKSNSVVDLCNLTVDPMIDSQCSDLAQADNISIYDGLRRWSKL